MRRFRPQQWPSALCWIVMQLLRATRRAHGEGAGKKSGGSRFYTGSGPPFAYAGVTVGGYWVTDARRLLICVLF
jgi:hypothetical protein